MTVIQAFRKHQLVFIFLLGFVIRILLVFLDYSWDVNNHIVWAKDLLQRGFRGFYEIQSSEVYATPYPNYPPLSLYFFYVASLLQPVVYKIAWFLNLTLPLFPSKLIFFLQERAFIAGMFKLPAIIADLGSAWLCYLFALRLLRLRSGQAKNKKWGLIAASFVLFNPAFFYNSAYWGQIDAIPVFFTLLSFYLLIYSKRCIFSGLVFTIGLLVKPTALVYLPLYAIFFIRKYGIKNVLKTVFISNILFWFSFLPFISNSNAVFFPYRTYIEKIMATQSLPFVTNGAFNFWVLITYFEGIKDTAPFLLGLSYRLWGYFLTFLSFALVIYSFVKKKEKINSFIYAIILGALASFLFLTKMHERYSILPLAFLLLASLKDRGLTKWFIALSLLSFLNLYHSWPVPRIELLIGFLSSPFVVIALSTINVLIFIHLLRRYLN